MCSWCMDCIRRQIRGIHLYNTAPSWGCWFEKLKCALPPHPRSLISNASQEPRAERNKVELISDDHMLWKSMWVILWKTYWQQQIEIIILFLLHRSPGLFICKLKKLALILCASPVFLWFQMTKRIMTQFPLCLCLHHCGQKTLP